MPVQTRPKTARKQPVTSSSSAQKTTAKASKHAPATTGKIRRPRRFKPGIRALKEIRRYQKTTDLLISRAPFARCVRDVLHDIGGMDPANPNRLFYRIQPSAIEGLQEAAEAAIIGEFEMTNLMAIHAKRVTIQNKDMHLVRKMREHLLGYKWVGNPLRKG